MPQHVCKVRRQLVGMSLLHYVGLSDGTQVTGLGGKCWAISIPWCVFLQLKQK